MLAVIIIFCAYFIFGVAGFGTSLVAVPLLVQIYPLTTVVPMMVLMDICASLYLGRKSSSEVDKKELLWLFPFSLVGMVIGITLLINAPSEPLLIALGIFAGANGLRVLMKKKVELRTPISKWWAMPFGFFGGIFTALFATGGAIYASYLEMRMRDPRMLRVTMTFAILILTGMRFVFMLVSELLLHLDIVALAICMLLPMFFGLWVGTKVHSKLSSSNILRIYGGILLFSGSMLLLKEIPKLVRIS
jgi:uncharacterized membrane protein YfcA